MNNNSDNNNSNIAASKIKSDRYIISPLNNFEKSEYEQVTVKENLNKLHD